MFINIFSAEQTVTKTERLKTKVHTFRTEIVVSGRCDYLHLCYLGARRLRRPRLNNRTDRVFASEADLVENRLQKQMKVGK